MSVTTRRQSARPAADMQWRARKIAIQAAKLADQAAPMRRTAVLMARQSAVLAKPRVGRVRTWMAVGAARGSVSMQESVGPRVAAILAATARRLDPPKPQSRRWPKVMAGTALLAAGAAAATAMAMRNKSRATPPPVPARRPASGSPAQRPTVLNPNVQANHAMAESEVNGLSRTR